MRSKFTDRSGLESESLEDSNGKSLGIDFYYSFPMRSSDPRDENDLYKMDFKFIDEKGKA